MDEIIQPVSTAAAIETLAVSLEGVYGLAAAKWPWAAASHEQCEQSARVFLECVPEFGVWVLKYDLVRFTAGGLALLAPLSVNYRAWADKQPKAAE